MTRRLWRLPVRTCAIAAISGMFDACSQPKPVKDPGSDVRIEADSEARFFAALPGRGDGAYSAVEHHAIPVPFGRGTTSRHGEGLDAELLILRDSASWRETWTRVVGAAEVPPVDFGSELVALVADREWGGSGYSIVVDRVYLGQDGGYVLVVRHNVAGDGCAMAAIPIRPVTALRLPRRRNVAVKAVHLTREYSCPH